MNNFDRDRASDSACAYDSPLFEMARKQFESSADFLQIPPAQRDRLLYPKRAMTFSVPITRDDGSQSVFQGYRVQHHLSLGPTKGGTRFAPGVGLGEFSALAIWMSWKCALAGLPFGGGKGGIAVDPTSLSPREFEALSRRYMQELIPFVGPHTDVMAPDMGTDDRVMGWFLDTYSAYRGHTVTEIVTGKPIECGGTRGRREATGRGVVHLIKVVLGEIGILPEKATVIVQGFGNVGSVVAGELSALGARIVGISDISGAFYDAKGLPVESMLEHQQKCGNLRSFKSSFAIDPTELLQQECDVLVPAANSQIITATNANKLKCRVLAEAANGPTTPEADLILDGASQIRVIPDILCNSGGVIVSYFEWVQGLQRYLWSEEEVNQRLYSAIESSYNEVRSFAAKNGQSLRQAALAIGVGRVAAARKARGLFP